MARIAVRNLPPAAKRRAWLPISRTSSRNLAKSLYDPYRPELHYMRGPGPKWHAKHDPAPSSTLDALPSLARVRVKG